MVAAPATAIDSHARTAGTRTGRRGSAVAVRGCLRVGGGAAAVPASAVGPLTTCTSAGTARASASGETVGVATEYRSVCPGPA